MGTMTYERTKVAPWEMFTDGEWHEVRRGPDDEPRDESLRQYRRHWDSMRAWTTSNGWRGQISREDNGRVLRVRITRPVTSQDVAFLRPLSRGQIGRHLLDALQILDYAMILRMHGERAPGGNETWAEFDRVAERFLRKVRRMEGGDHDE